MVSAHFIIHRFTAKRGSPGVAHVLGVPQRDSSRRCKPPLAIKKLEDSSVSTKTTHRREKLPVTEPERPAGIRHNRTSAA